MSSHSGRIVVGLALFATVAGASRSQAETPSYGMSFSFLNVKTSETGSCSVSRASTIHGTTFLPRYDDANVRTTVLKELSDLHRGGFKELRTLLFFGSIEKISKDWFDVERDGKRAARNVKSFIDDVKVTGFERFTLGFAQQGTTSPSCRKSEWGDCYDPAKAIKAAQFMLTVRRALGDRPTLRLGVELAVETCAPATLPAPMRGNLFAYNSMIVGAYVRAFPEDEVTISCAIHRFIAGRASIDGAFAAAGRRPSFYQIHTYHRPTYDTGRELVAISRALKDSNIPVVIGETTYGNRDHVQKLVKLLKPHGEGPRSIIFWPLRDAMNNCAVDTAAPYSLNAAQGLR